MTASHPVFKPVTLPDFQNGNDTNCREHGFVVWRFALIVTQAGCFIRSDVFGTGNAGLIHSRMKWERSGLFAMHALSLSLSLLSRHYHF